ncbi:hypothetical protein AX16_011044, partial [Volvariella volvacea WC 439]
PSPVYFTSIFNTITQPIAPEYARQNPEISLPIGEYIRQIKAQQLTQETAITNLVTSLQATREAV